MDSMRPSILATFAMMITVAFSGCLVDDPGDGNETDDDGSLGQNDNNTTPPPPASNNTTGGNGTENETGDASGTPPTANITADIENNTTPANVTYHLDAMEEDGDELNWTLDWDNDSIIDEEGTELPATVNVTYENPGNYTATLTVTDKDGNDTATADVTIESGTTGPAMCHRPDARAVATLWYDDRGGGGVWIYMESNDVEGLQVGGDQEAVVGGHHDDEFIDCENADTLIF